MKVWFRKLTEIVIIENELVCFHTISPIIVYLCAFYFKEMYFVTFGECSPSPTKKKHEIKGVYSNPSTMIYIYVYCFAKNKTNTKKTVFLFPLEHCRQCIFSTYKYILQTLELSFIRNNVGSIIIKVSCRYSKLIQKFCKHKSVHKSNEVLKRTSKCTTSRCRSMA